MCFAGRGIPFNSAGRGWGKQHELQGSEVTYKRENWNHSKMKNEKEKKKA